MYSSIKERINHKEWQNHIKRGVIQQLIAVGVFLHILISGDYNFF
jgi:hypothetical protein